MILRFYYEERVKVALMFIFLHSFITWHNQSSNTYPLLHALIAGSKLWKRLVARYYDIPSILLQLFVFVSIKITMFMLVGVFSLQFQHPYVTEIILAVAVVLYALYSE